MYSSFSGAALQQLLNPEKRGKGCCYTEFGCTKSRYFNGFYKWTHLAFQGILCLLIVLPSLILNSEEQPPDYLLSFFLKSLKHSNLLMLRIIRSCGGHWADVGQLLAASASQRREENQLTFCIKNSHPLWGKVCGSADTLALEWSRQLLGQVQGAKDNKFPWGYCQRWGQLGSQGGSL